MTIQTWARWAPEVERLGLAFSPAPEYPVFPTDGRPLKPYAAVVRAAGEAAPLLADSPDAVVADILTLAPALAAERAGIPVATLIPHVHPRGAPGFPTYSIGARLPRTAAGRALWRALEPPVAGARARPDRAQRDAPAARPRAPVPRPRGDQRRPLPRGDLPGPRYPRTWAAHEHVVGPLLWEPPTADVALPPGEEPLVLVAPSTSQDPDHRLLRACLDGLAGLPVRVLATWNRRPPPRPLPAPDNARVVDWFSYARTMPAAAVVGCPTAVTGPSSGPPSAAPPWSTGRRPKT